MRFCGGGRRGAHITTHNDKSGPTSYAATGGHRCHRLLLNFALPFAPPSHHHANPSQLHYPQSPSPHSIPTRVSHELEFPDSVEKQRSNSLSFWGRAASAGPQPQPFANCCCSSSPRTPEIGARNPDYLHGWVFVFFLFGLVLSLFSWSIACLVSVFVRFLVEFWGCVLLSFFEAVRGGLGRGREVVGFGDSCGGRSHRVSCNSHVVIKFGPR